MHAKQQTNVPSLHAMQLEDANLPQETVMIKTHVPLIAAILPSDVSTPQSLATTTIFATFPTAAQSRDVYPNQRTVMTRIHAPKIAALTDNV
jgi:hypothetical protein